MDETGVPLVGWCRAPMTLDVPLQALSLRDKDDQAVEEDCEPVYVERLTDEELVEYARYGELDILRELVAQQLSARLLATDGRGNTMLHMLAANGHLDCIRYMLRGLAEDAVRHAVLDQQNEEGNTALHWACISGQLAAVQLLMLEGAKPALENRAGRTPICEAHKHRRAEILAFFEEMLGRTDQGGSEQEVDQVEK